MIIKEYIQKYIDKDFDEELPFSIENKSVGKSYVITDFGQTESKVYFIQKGIVKVEIDSPTEIKILDFFFAPSFCSAYSSLLNQKESDVRIKTVTECDLEIIRFSELQLAYAHSLIANKLGRVATEKLYARRVHREKTLFTKGAKETYAELIEKYPEFLEHIPLKDIAKYLGITPESLSRIRKSLIS